MGKNRWNTRGFVSLLTFLSFIVLGLTGILLYVVPAGRVAFWVDWKFLWLTKETWSGIHTLFSLLFVISGITHIVLNWKPLCRYIVDKVKGGLNLKKEMALAGGLTLLFILSAILAFPPLQYVVDFGGFLKEQWVVSPDYEPPIGHAELLSLKDFCRKMNIDLEVASDELERSGIVVGSSGDLLKDIARANNTSPLEIYRIIKVHEPPIALPEDGRWTEELVIDLLSEKRLGQKTVLEFCRMVELDISVARERLEAKGFAFQQGEKLKDIADREDTAPLELAKIIIVEDY